MYWDGWQFVSLEAFCGGDGLQEFCLFVIPFKGRLQHPEQFKKFGCELAGPSFRADVIQRRGLPTRASLHAVPEPRLDDFQSRDLEFIDLPSYEGELALADVERLRLVVVLEGLGISSRLAWDGLGALRLAGWDVAARYVFRDEALAIGVEPEKPRSNGSNTLEKVSVPGYRHAQFARFQFLMEAVCESRMCQHTVNIGQEILRCYLGTVGLAQQVEQAGQEVCLRSLGRPVERNRVFCTATREVVKVGNRRTGCERWTSTKRIRQQTCQIHLLFTVGAPEHRSQVITEAAISSSTRVTSI